MKPYSILIFDWDGTIMDSAAHITHCMRIAIAHAEADVRTDTQIRNIIGLGLEEAVQTLFPDASLGLIRSVIQEFRQEFLLRSHNASELFAGARETLHTLQKQGYYLAIATGKSRRGLDKVLAETELATLFSITRCADETRSKPHPQMLEEILTDLNATPRDALMIGDSEYDLQMAQILNMDALGVSYGVHEAQRLYAYHPKTVVDTITAIPTWLATHQK